MSAWILFLGSYDERLLHAVVLRRRRLLDLLMHTVTRLADPVFAIAFSLVLASGVIPSLERTGLVACATLATSHLLVQILKRSISRPRPRFPVGMQSLIQAPDRFSFPSGHAAAGLSIFLPLAATLPTALAAGVLVVAFLVGVSRCYLGVHYPGDVLMGWLLAAASMLWLAEPSLALLL